MARASFPAGWMDIEDRGQGKTDFSPLNRAVVRHDVLDILKRAGAKMPLQRIRATAAGNSAFRAKLLASQQFSILPWIDSLKTFTR